MHNKLYSNVGDRVSEKNTHLRFISVQIQGAGWQSFLPALEILYTGGCKQWSEVIDDAIIETHKGMSNGCLFILPSFSITLLIWNYVSSKIIEWILLFNVTWSLTGNGCHCFLQDPNLTLALDSDMNTQHTHDMQKRQPNIWE